MTDIEDRGTGSYGRVKRVKLRERSSPGRSRCRLPAQSPIRGPDRLCVRLRRLLARGRQEGEGSGVAAGGLCRCGSHRIASIQQAAIDALPADVAETLGDSVGNIDTLCVLASDALKTAWASREFDWIGPAADLVAKDFRGAAETDRVAERVAELKEEMDFTAGDGDTLWSIDGDPPTASPDDDRTRPGRHTERPLGGHRRGSRRSRRRRNDADRSDEGGSGDLFSRRSDGVRELGVRAHRGEGDGVDDGRKE